MLVVELAEAYRHLAASWPRGCHYDERTRGNHIIVLPEAFIGVDEIDIGGVSVNDVVNVGGDADPGKLLAESVGTALPIIMGNDNRADHKTAALELFTQANDILVVGDAEVVANLVLFDVECRDDYHYLSLVGEL